MLVSIIANISTEILNILTNLLATIGQNFQKMSKNRPKGIHIFAQIVLVVTNILGCVRNNENSEHVLYCIVQLFPSLFHFYKSFASAAA